MGDNVHKIRPKEVNATEMQTTYDANHDTYDANQTQ